MPGVEPGSEDKTIKTPTFIACFLISLLTLRQAGLLRTILDVFSQFYLKLNKTASPSLLRLTAIPVGEGAAEDGLPNLFRQPLRSYSCRLN